MCAAHDARRRKFGEVFEDVPIGSRHNVGLLVAPGMDGRYWTPNRDGYLMAVAPGHPLASPSGALAQHRLVLFNAIGPGFHACDECGLMLSWDLRPPHPAALEADHRNGVKDDNRPENLRPLCKSCNSREAQLRRARASVS